MAEPSHRGMRHEEDGMGTKQAIGIDELSRVTGGTQNNSNNDSLAGDSLGNFLDGGNSQDTIDGRAGNDVLLGGEGDDKIRGGEGSDVVYAGTGQDTVFGNAGDDELNADGGDDRIFGGGGHDLIEGGQGHDVIHWAPGEGNDTVNGGADGDTLVLNFSGEGNLDRQFGIGSDDPKAMEKALEALLGRIVLDPGSAQPRIENGVINLTGVSGVIDLGPKGLGTGELIRFSTLEKLQIDLTPRQADSFGADRPGA
ncbi:calcium-binding protein [Falsiroseomonas sp. CW058]|uniref:calcium-binding protein n=1 Tax=Falsiroseomonas sp. CW058 TaxID=3388664 RepID=UPI003D30FBAF